MKDKVVMSHFKLDWILPLARKERKAKEGSRPRS
jgi:hypothetical protein